MVPIKNIVLILMVAVGLVLSGGAIAEGAKKPSYEGWKKCKGCHKSQKESWLDTKHKKAFNALKPGKMKKEKKKANLDPDKDYRKDKKCIGCHVTGFAKKGGFRTGLGKSKAKYLKGVGCEACHGPGSLYRKGHRKAGNKYKKKGEATERKPLLKMGQVLEFEDACARCHMNYEGSPWKGAKEPYTPFTPDLDPKYEFNFEEGIKDVKAMHEHFKLRGVYKGKPVTRFRDDFQSGAKEPAAEEEE